VLAVQLDQGIVSVVKRTKPRLRAGCALVRLMCGGICNTDIELQRGYYGFSGVPGHEFVGEVLEADDEQWIGKRVVGEINLACGKCEWCQRGLGRHCPKRTVLGIVKHPGAFREIIDLPETNLRVVPDRVQTEHAVFTEPIAAACEILEQVKIPRGERVAVLGDGKLGLLIAQVLQLHGAAVHQFGRHAEKLRIAATLGVATEVSRANVPVAAYDFVVEATGSANGLTQAVQMARPRGTIIMKSTVHDLAAINTAPIIVNEITLVGSRCGRFEPALKLLRGGKLRLDEMISDRFALSDAPRAFERAQERGVVKVLLHN
jgi:alcohol dehydrogenase